MNGPDLDRGRIRQALSLASDWLPPNWLSSVALGDAFEQDHPNREMTDRALDEYWRREWAPENMAWTWREVRKLAQGGRLRLWRSVTIAGDPVDGFRAWIDEKGHIGRFWAYDRDAAHPHDGDSGAVPGYLFEGTVSLEDVDWIETLAAAAQPDWVGESEVRLLDGAEVTLSSIVKREGWLRRLADAAETPVDAGSLVGTAFRAGEPTDAPTAGL